jgi:hydroxymethylglutaryl-CoA lyase
MRDGLQMESATVPLEKKEQWLEALAGTGLDVIQVGSFVHPTRVPQMADTDRLFLALTGRIPEGVKLSALVLNEKGLERGFACGVHMFCMGVSASETHSMKNTGMPIAEATTRIVAMAATAADSGAEVQVSVQSAFGCGYEGAVPQDRVLDIVRRYVDAGLRTISLADTAGHATPDQVERLYESVRAIDEGLELACHFHNTYGMAIANCYAAMRAGVRSFESSVAGLGGCPFTKIAGGNVSTEDLVHMLHRMGLRTDVSLEPLIGVARQIAEFFAREMPGTIYRTGPITSRPQHA